MGTPTDQVAKQLAVSPWRLYGLIRRRALPEPPRFGRGFIWSPALVEQARQVLDADRKPSPRR